MVIRNCSIGPKIRGVSSLSNNIIKTDVLVIGGGGAGSRAAIEADEQKVQTTIVCKNKYGVSGCTPNSASEWMAYGAALGIADPRDSCEAHFRDIVETGAYVCDQNLSRIIAYEAPDRFYELVEWGVDFLKQPNGKFLQVMSDGATYPRACGTGADTGRQIMNALKKQVEERGITVIENVMVIDLIQKGGVVGGAVGIDINTLEQTVFLAKSVILATGGHGGLYSFNVFPPGMTGDGYAMALRAGAKLVNIEFMQIGPCVVTPFKFDVGGVLWRLGPRLINGRGEEYLAKYLPAGLSVEEVYRLKSVTFPFTMRNPSGYIDVANFTEILEGRGTEKGCVLFDLSHVPSEIIEEKASIPFKFFLERGVDIRKEPLQIAPAIQHLNGGVLINEKAETTLIGLYAAGEVAGGPHGADRPGGNSLADCQVFGARAGKYAALRAKRVSRVTGPKDAKRIEEFIDSVSKSKGNYDVETLMGRVKQLMWRNVSIVRRGRDLNETLRQLSNLRKMATSQLSVDEEHAVGALELRNMVELGMAITKAALTRKETRGSHYRGDYPERNDRSWLRIIEIEWDGGDPSINTRSPKMIIHP
jgi:succinate dehydrogenase/fumarate reductase flavoprotein subunit